MKYFQVTESSELPDIARFQPFKVVLAIEENVSPIRQHEISSWLVEAGASYVMVCGSDCENWQASIRRANIAVMDTDAMNPREFVMITTHEKEKLRHTYWYARKHARHTHVKIQNTLTVHIGSQNRSVEYHAIFDKA